MIYLLLWLPVGCVVALLLTRLRPAWFFEPEEDRRWFCSKCKSVPDPSVAYRWRYDQYDVIETKGFTLFVAAVLFWPVALFIAGLSMLGSAAFGSYTNKTRLRAELERELAAARAEIDAFMKDKAP